MSSLSTADLSFFDVALLAFSKGASYQVPTRFMSKLITCKCCTGKSLNEN